MSGSSRKDSGVGSKSRYNSLNLSHSYKGPGHEYKSNQKRGAMQSLGKISTNARRMPAPAQLRSLKSSNDGQDPSVALVPQGGGGWTKDEEKEKEKEDPLNYTRKTEKPQKTVVPEGFKTNFPSLEEQEKMSKKEREELEKRQREEENCEEESIESPPTAPPPSSRGHHSRKQPKEAWGGNQEEPPYHQGGGQPSSHSGGGPVPQGLYHQRRDRQPYMPHPRTGRYPSGPPPSYHQNPHYRHTGAQYPHHHGYSQPHPPFIDPYSIPPKDQSSNPRPSTDIPTALESSLKDSEHQLEEDDDGWAGHQEEVDYSKEVVFEDSSDEDSPKKGQKEQNKARTNVDEERVLHNTQVHLHHSKQDPPQNMPHPPHGGHAPYPQYNYHHPPPMPYPPYPPSHAAGWYPSYHQQQGGQGDHSYDQDPNRPPRGRPPPQTTNVGGKNRRNQHAAWSESSHEDYTNWTRSDGGSKNDGNQMTTADKVSKNQTHFESVQSPLELEPLVTPPTDTVSRNPPKKIMIRDLGDKVDSGSAQQHGQRVTGDKDSEGDNLKKVVWGGVKSQTTQPPPQDSSSGYQQNESPVPPLDEPQAVLKDRGHVQSSKTLYEPEGRTSQEKFRKYQRSMSGGGGASEHHTHTHGKHKKTSRSDSRGSEGDGKSPVSMADEMTAEEERKRVLIKKHEDKPDGDPSTTRGRDKSWKGDGRRDRDSKGGSGRYDEKRRSGPIDKGGNDRRKDSQRDETNHHHEPRGNTKPHPPSSHHSTKRTKSEEECKQPQPQRGSGKGQQDSKVSHKQNTTTAKPVSSNKRQNDRHDSDTDNTRMEGGHRTRNNADKPDPRTHPSRRVQTDVTRTDRQDRNKPQRQDGSHHDTRAPQSHSKQSDSRYPTQDQVRGSGSKSRKEYQSTQNASEGTHTHKSKPVQPYRGQQKGRDSYRETMEYNEDDDVFEDQGSSSTIDQYSHQDTRGDTRGSRSSKPSKTANEPKQKNTRQDPVSSRPNPVSSRQESGPSRQDPVPSRQDPVPSRQDSVPFRQDPGSSHSTRPNRSRDHNKHDSSNRFNEPHNKPDSTSSRKGFRHRQDPNPPVQDPNPPRHDPNPSRLDPNPPKQDPNPPKQESNSSRQGPNPPRLDPVPPRLDPIPLKQDSIPPKQDPIPPRQDPIPPRQDPIPPRQDPIPPRLDLDPLKQDSKQESRWNPQPSAKQDREHHHNKEPKPSRDENERPKSKPETKQPDQKKDLEFGGSKRRQEYDEYDQDYNERYKRRSNTREDRGGHSGRGRGGRWGRGYGDYEDDDYRSAPSFRRSNRKHEEDEFDNYPSRTFDRSKRGGGRGRDRRGGGSGSGRVGRDGNSDKETSEKKDTSNKGEEKKIDEIEEKPPVVYYSGLDDIDSASDWDEDNEGGEGEGGVDIPSNNKRKLSENDRPRYRERGGGARKYSRNFGERNKRNERYRDEGTAGGGTRGSQRHQQHHASTNTGRKDGTDSIDKDTPPNQDPPAPTTKDPNFNKYDINAHNVVVVDRRSSLSDGEAQFVGVADEGFIKVKSKRDKHKDREDRKKTDGNSKRGDDHSGRHKGFLGRGPEQSNNGGKGWGHVQQKKTESVSRDGNGDWTINEGRSAYGAIGDKPSKEKGSSNDDTRKTTNLSANPGYKLFETADKGKNTAFSFESPLSNTPRKGERLQAAIDITLPQNMAHLTNEQSTIVSDVSTAQKGHDLPSTESVSSSGVKSNKEQQVSKNVEESEPHPRMGGGRGDNKHRKAKTEQRFYTPPAARPDTGGPRGQRSHTSSKHGTTSTTHSKVHHHDDPGEHQMADALEEDSSPSSRHHDNTKKETAVVRGVYLQQHQGLGGHMMVSEDATNQSGNNEGIVSTNIDNNGPHPFDSVNETNDNDPIRKVHVLKELTSNKSLSLTSSVSSTKFGSVSYASALKMKAQVKSIKGGGGVIIDETVPSDMANLLSPKLNRQGGGDGLLVNYTGEESDCASGGAGEFDSMIPLHDVLREAVLSHSDENEVDGGSTHRYTPSSPRQSEDTIQPCYPVPVASSGQPPGVSKPMSPSTQFTKPFSPPVGGGALTGPFPKPLYSGIGVSTGEGNSLGVEQSSPSYTSEKDQDMMTGGGGVVKQLLKEENVRPSSAQSLSESPFIARLQQGRYGGGISGGESPSHHGGSGNTSGGLPLTRVSSAPSHLPLNAIEQNEIVESDDTDSVKTDDSISTSSKSILNIEANEFVPNQQLARKRPSSQYSNQQKPQTRSVRGYQGQRARGGGPPVQNHQKGHAPHGGKHYQHRHTPQQQPHSPNQQQSLLNKPPLDVLLQLFLKNVQLLPTGGLALPPTQPTMPVPLSPLQTSQSVPHPSLPLNFPPMSSGSAMPYPVTHPPPTGVPMTQSRKMSQEGVVPPPPHAGGMPHPSLASAPPLQYITTGSKVGGNVAPPTDSGTPEVGQVSNVIPSGNHPPPPPPYFTATPLHPNQTPPQMPTVIFPHPNHHLPSTRSSHATPINGPQVPQPLAIIPSLQLAPPRPPPVMVDQQTNSNNSRPPLLPTPPGFNLLHQSSTAATPTVMTPSIHHPNWPVNPPIRLGLPPNMQSHDRSSIIQFPHMPQSN